MAMKSRGVTSLMAVRAVTVPINAPTNNGVSVTRQRIERRTGLQKLVALVAAAAQEVEHGVDDRVEHADAEAADEGAEQVNDEVELEGDALAHVADGDVGTDDAGEVLHEETRGTDGHGDEGRLLVTDAHEHAAGRDTHEEVGQEVHHVTHHAERIGTGVLVFPDSTDGGREIRDERDHREEKEHRDDGHDGQLVVFGLFH